MNRMTKVAVTMAAGEPLTLKHLRNAEYHGLLDTARENLALGISVIVVGPLSREVRDHLLHDPDWLRVPAGTKVRTLWVHLPEDEARARIEWEAEEQRRLAEAPAPASDPSGGAATGPVDPEVEQARIELDRQARASKERLEAIRTELGVDPPT